MIQRTKCGWVLRKLVISLFRFSCSERDAIGHPELRPVVDLVLLAGGVLGVMRTGASTDLK